jgi:tetratricopeptide (TPR) repeat protein
MTLTKTRTNATSIRGLRRALSVPAGRIVLVLVTIVGAIGTAAAQPSPAWRSASSGVELAQLPSGWRMVRSDAASLELAKRFVSSDGIWFDESITINVGSQSIGEVESTTSKMSDRGYSLFDRDRLRFDGAEAPYWLFRQDSQEESNWVAIVFHSHNSTVVHVRTTPIDEDRAAYILEVLAALRLSRAPRDDAWRALISGNATEGKNMFQSLLRADSMDANARYGLGLAYLALKDYDHALSELQKAAPSLGIGEDVRRALGETEFERGNPDRAVALWIQVMRTNPTWEDRLRSSILKATANARAPKGKELDELITIAISFLQHLRGGDQGPLNALLHGYQDVFDQAIDHCLAGQCSARAGMLAAFDIEQAMVSAISGVESGQDTESEKLTILSALGDIGSYAASASEN